MSPKTQEDELLGLRFPRVSGDEPGEHVKRAGFEEFSPREWG